MTYEEKIRKIEEYLDNLPSKELDIFKNILENINNITDYSSPTVNCISQICDKFNY